MYRLTFAVLFALFACACGGASFDLSPATSDPVPDSGPAPAADALTTLPAAPDGATGPDVDAGPPAVTGDAGDAAPAVLEAAAPVPDAAPPPAVSCQYAVYPVLSTCQNG